MTLARDPETTRRDLTIVRGACPHDCPDTCAMLYHVEDGRLVDVTGDPEHPMTRGGLCVKLKDFPEHHYQADRLLHPMRRVGPKGAGEFERITWGEALDEIRARWTDIIAEHGPQAIMPHAYLGHQGVINGLTAGDAFFNRLGATVAEKTYCESGSSTAWHMTVGGTGGLDIESMAYAKYIVVWGMNMTSTNLHGWPFLLEARRKGAKIVVIDPVRTRTARQADWHIRIRPGTDGALAMGLIHEIVVQGLVDTDYVERHTVGFDELAERAVHYPPERVEEITGVPAEDVRVLAREYATTQPAAIRQGVAIERSRGGGQAIRAITCLPALVGAMAARRRRHDGDADLGVPDEVRRDLHAAVDPRGNAGDQRAGPRHGTDRRDGARPADPIALRLQLQPRLTGPGAGQDDGRPDARRPLHRRQRPLRQRHGQIRRPRAAGDDAGRAARHHGHLGAPLHLAQPARDRPARRVRPELRAVPSARPDHGVHGRLLGPHRRADAPRLPRLGRPRVTGHHLRLAQGDRLGPTRRRAAARARAARGGELPDAVGQVRVPLQPRRGRQLRRPGLALDVRGDAAGRRARPTARLRPAVRVARLRAGAREALPAQRHRVAETPRLPQQPVRERREQATGPGRPAGVDPPRGRRPSAGSSTARSCGCSTTAGSSPARPCSTTSS